MNTVIEKISQIENAAASVMDSANARKKAFAQEMEEKTAAFDKALDAETEKALRELQANMEVQMNRQLEKQKADAQETLQRMQKNYDDHHAQYAEELFRSLIGE